MDKQFSVLNESSLHNTLKKLYSLDENSLTEVEKDGHIYDIVTKDGNVIEIQNLNVSRLLPKVQDTLSKGRKITIVHPAVISRTLITLDDKGNKLSERKSPKKGSIYDIFKELTGMHSVLLNPDFTLEVPLISIIEIREHKDEKVQSKNRNRRFKKDWIKTDKKLNEIMETYRFCSSKDYLKLLPQQLAEKFSVKDIKTSLDKTSKIKVSEKSIRLMIWVYLKMNLICFVEKKGNTKLYSICR